MLVLYADPERRKTNLVYPSKVTGEATTGWTDLGYIRGEVGGIRLGANVNSEVDLKNGDTWKTPQEVYGAAWKEEYAGWGITVAEKYIYMYDYIKNEWYESGDFALSPELFIAVADTSDSLELVTGGFWFVKETMSR